MRPLGAPRSGRAVTGGNKVTARCEFASHFGGVRRPLPTGRFAAVLRARPREKRDDVSARGAEARRARCVAGAEPGPAAVEAGECASSPARRSSSSSPAVPLRSRPRSPSRCDRRRKRRDGAGPEPPADR